MILVVGATALVGSAVCEELRRHGERVKALVRATSSKEKIHALRTAGVEFCVGDLKDRQSIDEACRGVDAVISTASSTLSRQPGDSIASVDANGQLNLVNAAGDAGIGRFVFVSFRRPAGVTFPLADAKQQVENAVASLDFTIIQASWFMEVWLSPALGFDYATTPLASMDPEPDRLAGSRSVTSPKSARWRFGTRRRAGRPSSSAARSRSAH